MSESTKNRWSWSLYMLMGAVLFGLLCLAVLWFMGRRGVPLQPFKGSKLDAVTEMIRQRYVDSVSSNEIEEKALIELLHKLDPHSEYIPAEAMARIQETMEGDFEGVGIQFNMLPDTLIVLSVIPGGPSAKAGLENGDRIIRIEGTNIAGVNFPQDSVVHMLRGKSGTLVHVDIQRGRDTTLIPYQIERGKIPLYSVDYAMMADPTTGVIRINNFAGRTPEEFQSALMKLADQGMMRLVLDLRGNPGGLLNSALFVAGVFLPKDSLIIYTEGAHRPRQEFKNVMQGPLRNIPLAILIDEYSASASEIVAGSLQDQSRAIIVGRRSYGKGLVMEQMEFPDGSGLRLTTARYYTPSGRCIQKPYNLGDRKDYDADIFRRWKHGELQERDSIHLDTVHRYYTAEGKPVFGGGGIMPDLFVPIDTTASTPFLRQVSRKAMRIRFAQHYSDAHREELNTFGSVEAMAKYLYSQPLMTQFLAYAKTQGAVPSAEELTKSRKLLDEQLVAQIVRNFFNEEGFYRVMMPEDDALQAALGALKGQ